MNELLNHEPGEVDDSLESPADATAPVVPDELIKGDWHRRLVLPDQHGHLRLTPVKTSRGPRAGPATRIRYLDDPQRNSA
ncbi:MAG TPA: hypothetical protein VFB89_02415 [Gemmatimonadales bacterium]|nr:hypothetical protein [Gemmatimonadales bacterium]